MENMIILGSGQKIEVLFQDEVSLDIDCALRYIESGQKEIAAYVQNTAKPQLDGVIAQAETDMAVQIAKGVADAASTASAAAAETINNSIDNANAQIEAYVAANITPDLDTALASAENQAQAAAASASAAADSASSAAAAVDGFDEHAAAKQNDFDTNAAARQTAFNDNAASKQQQVDAAASAALNSQTSAAASAELALNWAAKTDGTVDGEDYSAKYYALQAANVGLPLFMPFWSDHLLENMSFLRADTFSWHSGTVYEAAYNKLLTEYNDTSAATETDTIGEVSVVYKRTPSGMKIAAADQEQNVLNLYDAEGISWYYILDLTNIRFKLPRSKWNFAGLRTAVGDYISESLPNITGNYSVGAGGIWMQYQSGAFAACYTSGTARASNTSGSCDINILFDASKSSATYQNGAPVQERATQMYLYFYAGAFAETAVEQTAGLNAELFNGKADTDLNNVTAAGKKSVVDWGIPDYSAGVTLNSTELANGYTPPCAGVVICYNVASSKMTQWYVNDVFIFRSIANNSNNFPVQVSLGSQDVLKVTGTLTDLSNIMFYPYKGVSGNA